MELALRKAVEREHKMRLELKVLAIVLSVSAPQSSIADDMSANSADSQNVMIKNILGDSAKSEFGSPWLTTLPKSADSSSFVLSTPSITDATNKRKLNRALLSISCLDGEAGVSLLFDGQQEILSPIVQLDLDLGPNNTTTYFGTPMVSYDSVGVFRNSAKYFVRHLMSSDGVTITLPASELGWKFNLSKLKKELMQFDDRCGFVNWKQWDIPMLRMLLLELHRKSNEGVDFEKEINFVNGLLHGTDSEEKENVSDYQRLQEILRKVK